MAEPKISLIGDYITRKQASRLNIDHVQKSWGDAHPALEEVAVRPPSSRGVPSSVGEGELSVESSGSLQAIEPRKFSETSQRASILGSGPIGGAPRISRLASIRLSSAADLLDAERALSNDVTPSETPLANQFPTAPAGNSPVLIQQLASPQYPPLQSQSKETSPSAAVTRSPTKFNNRDLFDHIMQRALLSGDGQDDGSASEPPPQAPERERFGYANDIGRSLSMRRTSTAALMLGRKASIRFMEPDAGYPEPPGTAPPAEHPPAHYGHGEEETPASFFTSRRLSILQNYSDATRPQTTDFMNKRRSVDLTELSSSPRGASEEAPNSAQSMGSRASRKSLMTVHHNSFQRTLVPLNTDVLADARESVLNARRVYKDARKPGTSVERGVCYSNHVGVPLNVPLGPVSTGESEDVEILASPSPTRVTHVAHLPPARPTTARSKHERLAALKERAGLQ